MWLRTVLFRYFIHRLSVMEWTWLIYVNVIDCAEVMMNSFCSVCLCLCVCVCIICLFVCFSRPICILLKRIFISAKRFLKVRFDFQAYPFRVRVKNEHVCDWIVFTISHSLNQRAHKIPARDCLNDQYIYRNDTMKNTPTHLIKPPINSRKLLHTRF